MSLETKLQELLQFAKKNNLMEMSWKEGDMKIAFRRNPTGKAAAAPEATPAAEASNGSEPAAEEKAEFVKSPIVGTFRRAGGKGRPPIVMVGNHIKAGDQLAVVECMKIPTEVVSYCAGEIKEILVEDGQPVEYGQPLFSINPAEAGSNGNV